MADVSFVGTCLSIPLSGGVKLLPNPNVMLELGFASATVGWDRIITVMNEHYGLAEQQIFDLKSRRFPIRYTVEPNPSTDFSEIKRLLNISMEQAIRLALSSRYEAVDDIIKSLDGESLRVIRMCAKDDVFWRSSDNTVVANMAMDVAFRHLLTLRLINGSLASESEHYEYRWTDLGKQTLIQLGLRQQT